MSDPKQLIKLRARKLGVLMYDARMASRRSAQECASLIGVPVEQYQAYESGQNSPSLPELEALAYYFDVPLEQFWGRVSLSESQSAREQEPDQGKRLRQLRDRIIGARLRMARNQANLTIRQMSEKIQLPESQLKSYELGEMSIPLPELEVMGKLLEVRTEDFYDNHGPLGSWRIQQQSINKFLELNPELQQFVCKPVNKPYLELAMRLSALSVEKLRTVAEGLLEITY
jgi:transcriptional regulator with XRE-family HTH domain